MAKVKVPIATKVQNNLNIKDTRDDLGFSPEEANIKKIRSLI